MAWFFLAAMLTGPVTALAQVSGVAPLERSPLQRVAPPLSPSQPAAPILVPQSPADAPPPGAERIMITVLSVQVDDATAYPWQDFVPLWAGLVGRTVPATALFDLAQQIQAKYRSDGYVLSRAFVPQQQVSDGVFRIRVVEGFISRIAVEGNIGPVAKLIEGFAAHVLDKHPVAIADIERVLLLTNDIPGISAHSVLRPATEPGASDLVIQAERTVFGGYSTLDNRGPRFLGPWQFALDAGLNSLTQFGERSEAIFFNTLNPENFFGQASTEGYIGTGGLKLRFFAGHGTSDPGGALAAVLYHSDLTVGGVSLIYPLIRTRRLNVNLSASFDFNDATIDSLNGTGGVSPSSESLTRVLRVAADTNFHDDWLGITSAGIKLHQGLDIWDATPASDALAARPGVGPEFTKVTMTLSRLQALFTVKDVTANLLLSAAGQYTDDILPPNEKFFLGGDQFGRGYYSGEVTGDRAAAVTVELQFNVLPQFHYSLAGQDYDGSVQLYAFYDGGLAWDVGPNPLPRREMQTTGIGSRMDLTSFLSGELEAVHRFDRRPEAPTVAPLSPDVFYMRVVTRF